MIMESASLSSKILINMRHIKLNQYRDQSSR